jgi:hypothetical protein
VTIAAGTLRPKRALRRAMACVPLAPSAKR